MTPRAEVPGNGIDDDCDGTTDERLTCERGTVEACFTYPDGTPGLGNPDIPSCEWGHRTCEADVGGGSQWGRCEDAVFGLPEDCSNGVDDDCDALIDCDDNSCAAECCNFGELPFATFAIPDNVGESFSGTVLIDQFTPGTTVTGASDIVRTCAVMEHSWMRDLQIDMTCPSGVTVALSDFEGTVGGEVFLGEPIDPDGIVPTPGVGYEYCWEMGVLNIPMIPYANAFDPGTLPPGNYQPSGDVADYAGCPLNGEWTFTATDLWSSDNGYVFHWTIQFADDLACSAP